MKLFKTRAHPFCGLYLRSVLRWISVAGLFSGETFMTFHLIGEIQRDYNLWVQSYNEEPFEYYFRLFLWIVSGSQILIAASLYLLLFKAASQKIIKLLVIYMGVSAVNILAVQTTFWVYVIHFSTKLPNKRFGLLIIDIFFKSYLIYAVYRFIEEIAEEADMASEFRDLTECELYEFENGLEMPTTSHDFELKPFMDRIQYVKYKKDDFEIALRELELDKRMPLGSGTFGTVYRALLCRITDIERYPVAVKTTNPLSSNVEHFKALLSELKVMTFIGNHKNIVNLIGACTEDVKKRKLYIVVELCVFGNLQTYLKSQRGTFNDLTEDASYIKRHISISFNNDESSTNTKDLVRWTKEIADGMQFLESRKVVHGDLAARNVLLTEQRVAKITDFGLSRQLYNYAVYTKTQNSPLPWRWLSLETILDMQFSSQSDVWSYGVTMWEMFQLGDTPWPGSKFCVDFVEELKSGMRLNKPTYASQSIYQIMLNCWHENPENRPSFNELSGDFHAIFLQFKDTNINAITL